MYSAIWILLWGPTGFASRLKKGHQLYYYYYVVESARVDGKPRIVHQAYLGTADKVVALVKDRTSPVPWSAASHDFGLPGALWLAAQQPDSRRSWRSSGRLPDPVLRRPATCCWRPSTASVNPGRKPRWPTGTAAPFCNRFGGFRRNASPRKPSGMLWKGFCPTTWTPGHRRGRSAGPRPTISAGFVERQAEGKPAPARLRYHQLPYLYRQYRQQPHAPRTGPTRAQ